MLSTVKARSIALGGAFMAVKDDLASLDFNPAAFSLESTVRRAQISVFLNPLGPFIIKENLKTTNELDAHLGWIFRGVGMSIGRISIGLLWGEEALTDVGRLERRCIFNGTGYSGQRNASFGISINLAPRVSLGFAGETFIRKKGEIQKWYMGYRYGIIIKPKNTLTVGLCFVGFPDSCRGDRMTLERLADETLNVGVCFSPWKELSLALDIRNVSDEGKGAVREPHVGFELSPFDFFSFRSGYYRVKGGEHQAFSVGIGLIHRYGAYPNERLFLNPTIGLDATLVWEKDVDGDHRWIFLSCMLKL